MSLKSTAMSVVKTKQNPLRIVRWLYVAGSGTRHEVRVSPVAPLPLGNKRKTSGKIKEMRRMREHAAYVADIALLAKPLNLPSIPFYSISSTSPPPKKKTKNATFYVCLGNSIASQPNSLAPSKPEAEIEA